MRVIMVIPGTEEGSSMIFAKRQAECLRQQLGIDVHIFYLSSRASFSGLIRESKRFSEALREFRPHCVHAQYGTVTSAFCRILTRAPLVVTFRGSDLNRNKDIGWVRSCAGHLISQFSALTATSIICVGANLRSRLWWKKSRTTIIPSGVDTSQFVPTNKTNARHTLGWCLDEKIVLFNAGCSPRTKRLDLAKAAFAISQRNAKSNYRLHVLRGETHWSRMPSMVSASDCVLVTSDHEGAPSIIQEALACNTPVITVDAGDAASLVRGVSGCYVVARKPAAIANAITHVCESGAPCDGRQRAQTNSLINVCIKTAACYQEAVMTRHGTK